MARGRKYLACRRELWQYNDCLIKQEVQYEFATIAGKMAKATLCSDRWEGGYTILGRIELGYDAHS